VFQFFAERFELSREIAGANLRAMEGMRGFAVTLVFLTHFCTLIAPSLKAAPELAAFATAVHAIGNTGVDLFFALSGYLIYKSLLGREQNFFKFMWRRIRRIYPAFLTVFVVYWILSLVFPNESSIPAEAPFLYLAENLLLLPGLFPIKPMITVAWSLSYEMFFYICLPIVITALALRRRDAVARIAFIAIAAISLATWCSVFHGNHIRLIMFMLGMLVHEAIDSRQVRAPSGVVAASALIVGLAGSLLPVTGYVKFALLFTSFYLVCMNCFVRPGETLGRAFSWTPLRWLGNMSYSYYLLHGLTLKALFMVVMHNSRLLAKYPLPMFCLLLAIFFLATLCTSAALFLMIEKPLSLGTSAHRQSVTKNEGHNVVHEISTSKG
jgi:peptidoglycan/LPS O-acetylase OafA/YrhL